MKSWFSALPGASMPKSTNAARTRLVTIGPSTCYWGPLCNEVMYINMWNVWLKWVVYSTRSIDFLKVFSANQKQTALHKMFSWRSIDFFRAFHYFHTSPEAKWVFRRLPCQLSPTAACGRWNWPRFVPPSPISLALAPYRCATTGLPAAESPSALLIMMSSLWRHIMVGYSMYRKSVALGQFLRAHCWVWRSKK